MKLYHVLFEDFKQMYLGYATLAIILTTCIGGAATMVILMNGHDATQMIQLFMAVAVCMWYNTTILANMKPKFIFNSLLMSLGVCIALIIVNLWVI